MRSLALAFADLVREQLKGAVAEAPVAQQRGTHLGRELATFARLVDGGQRLLARVRFVPSSGEDGDTAIGGVTSHEDLPVGLGRTFA